MRKIVTPALHFAWAAIFGVLGIALVPGGATMSPLAFELGTQHISVTQGDARELAAFILALFCLSSAVLFAWACAVSASSATLEEGGSDQISRTAFAVGAGALTLCIVAGSLFLVKGAFSIALIALAGLISSYVATFLERVALLMASEETADDVRAAARLMAMGAAHSAMLSNITGRGGPADRGASQ